MSGAFLEIDSVQWPNPCDLLNAAWQAHYEPYELTADQSRWLTSVTLAYERLIYLPTHISHIRIMQIRKAIKDAS